MNIFLQDRENTYIRADKGLNKRVHLRHPAQPRGTKQHGYHTPTGQRMRPIFPLCAHHCLAYAQTKKKK